MAIGPYPWKQMNHGLAVNKPDTDWFNAVTRALYTMSVRIGTTENAYIERPNTDGSHWNIVLPPSLAGAAGGLYHFQCSQDSDTTFRIYGGSWWRHDQDEVGVAVPLTTDGGTSADVSDYKTITVSGTSVSKYAYLTLDDSKDPATLTAGFDTLANIDADNVPKTRLVLCRVDLDAGGDIEALEQYYRGGDYSDAWITPDNTSMEFANGVATFENLQQYGWAGAADSGNIQEADLVSYKDANDGNQQFGSASAWGAWIASYIDSNNLLNWNGLGDTLGNPSVIGTLGMIPRVTDQGGGEYKLELIDLSITGVGPFWVKGLGSADCYGTSIGKDASTPVIDLTNQQLEDNATPIVAWSANGLEQTVGDLWFTGAGTGLPYGEIYAYNVNATQTISGSGIANKVQVTAFAVDGVSNLMTPDHTNDHITITKTGVYKISVAVSLQSAAGATFLAGFAVYKNNGATLLSNLHFHRQLAGGGGDTGSANMTGLVSLTANDTIEVWCYNDTNTADIIIDDITMDIVMVGG